VENYVVILIQQKGGDMPREAKREEFGFGPWVRRRRAEINLTLRRFALETELDPGNLSEYERELLPPPQDPTTLDRMARALQLKKGTDVHREFTDLAAASAGRIPADLQSDPKVIARMPLLFRAARGRKLSREELMELAEKLKEI
jgi:transcriptional regulator with XRE-family HTH domain